MYRPDEWEQLNSHDMLGVTRAVPAAAKLLPMPGLGRSAGPAGDGPKPWHPDNALFWFGALLLLTTAGIVGASTAVKAGPYKATAQLGTT